MKLVSYKKDNWEQLAVLFAGVLYDTDALHPDLPPMMHLLLKEWNLYWPLLNKCVEEIPLAKPSAFIDEVELLAPVPQPRSCRDGYAFRQHVEAARHNRGMPMILAFDLYPVFYFTNHQSIQGPGNINCMPDHFDKLDFEFECAIVICKQGKNITAAEADEYIGGLMIMNDMSARTLQMEEMLLNLGPAKGKDFSTVIGPSLVTTDELQQRIVAAKPGHVGKSWNLTMEAFVNDELVSTGNLSDMDWTFAELIERASYGVTLYPGDIIGSGTVGTGCFLELNGTRKLLDPSYREQWLKPGDKIELRMEELGTLQNIIVKEGAPYSIRSLIK